ncbi:sensor histidine kinase [Paracraurococcus lichenis]|uniref:histidine kinase n=1 Tax=Paracraurococcus lichenis TaxID=3064888 RepID=A0ABT9E4B2_9PROT|nr:PAS domain S-box protein [Paracraurococcus sp. LOR1-02]MDO9710996.1 PAS domain S-box protein [Paracraurococcus sp. LOR1-02]
MLDEEDAARPAAVASGPGVVGKAAARAVFGPLDAALHESRQRLEAVVSQAAVGIGLTDAEGRFVLVNDRHCAILGRTRQELLGGLRMQDLTHPEDRPGNLALFHRLLDTGEPFALEKRYLRPDGTPVWVEVHVSPTRDPAGQVDGAMSVILDATARRAAAAEREALLAALETARQEAELGRGQLAAILEYLPVGVGIVDTAGRMILGNPALHRFLATAVPSTDAALAARWVGYHPDGRRIAPQDFPVARALRGERVVPGADFLHHGQDGAECWTRVAAVPVPGPAGSVAGAVLLVEDVDARVRAEARREVVLAELNHRVKNILATIQGLAAQTLKGVGGDPRRFAQHFGARLRTLARAHDLLTAHGWEPTGVEEVIRTALAPWLGTNRAAPSIGIVNAAGTAKLSPAQAQALVLAFHELATNATKYGALSVPGGRVGIRCEAAPGATVLLHWTETGGPPVSRPPDRRGFGTRLLERGLAHDLGPGSTVTLHFDPAGLQASIRFTPAPMRGPG